MRLHRVLDGEDVEPPFSWLLSRVCEEFSCTPSQAYREIMDDPTSSAMEIMRLRGYARAYDKVMQARKQKQGEPSGPDVEIVYLTQHEVVQEDRANVGLDRSDQSAS